MKKDRSLKLYAIAAATLGIEIPGGNGVGWVELAVRCGMVRDENQTKSGARNYLKLWYSRIPDDKKSDDLKARELAIKTFNEGLKETRRIKHKRKLEAGLIYRLAQASGASGAKAARRKSMSCLLQDNKTSILSGPVAITKYAKRAEQTCIAYSGDVNSPGFLQSYEWRTLRYKVLVKYGRKCMCCGATPETGSVMHVDHIKPRRLFPKLALEFDNLQVLCEACNHGKSNGSFEDFRPEVEYVDQEVISLLRQIAG